MPHDVEELLRKAMTLSVEERANLAGKLLASLSKEAKLDPQGKWRDNMMTKIAEDDPNASKLIEWEDAKRRAKLPKR